MLLHNYTAAYHMQDVESFSKITVTMMISSDIISPANTLIDISEDLAKFPSKDRHEFIRLLHKTYPNYQRARMIQPELIQSCYGKYLNDQGYTITQLSVIATPELLTYYVFI